MKLKEAKVIEKNIEMFSQKPECVIEIESERMKNHDFMEKYYPNIKIKG